MCLVTWCCRVPEVHSKLVLADDGLPPLRDVIRSHQLTARKSLGQNFILDLNLTRKIARSCGDLAGKTVIEVGPGPGGLTRGLLHQGVERVIAIERDERCLVALGEIAAHWPGRLAVHAQDALDVDWSSLLGEEEEPCRPEDTYIIANLPYGVATKLLVTWLAGPQWPTWYGKMGLMFQREVAERIVASPGSRSYGRLSVISQWRCETRIALTLPAAAFTPPPKVDSAVVTFTARPQLEPNCRFAPLEKVTAAAFGQRRKMLKSSLKQLTPFPELLLEKAGIEPTVRAEDVPVSGFAHLALALDC